MPDAPPVEDRAAAVLLEDDDVRTVAALWPQLDADDRAAHAARLSGRGLPRARRACDVLLGAGLVLGDGSRSRACESWLKARVVAHEAKAVSAGTRARRAAG